jgi:hypothetical protein
MVDVYDLTASTIFDDADIDDINGQRLPEGG